MLLKKLQHDPLWFQYKHFIINSVHVFCADSQQNSHQSIFSLKSKGFWFKPQQIRSKSVQFIVIQLHSNPVTFIKTQYTPFIIQMSDQDESQSKKESICTKNPSFLTNKVNFFHQTFTLKTCVDFLGFLYDFVHRQES